MVTMESNAQAHRILTAETLEPESLVSLRHLARQYLAEREAVEADLASLARGNVGEKETRLAAACWALERPREAASHATKAPDDATGALVRGLVAEDQEDFEEALKQYRRAAEKAPTSPPCVLRQIEALRRLGRPEEALKTVETLRREFSDKADLAYYEGRCLEDVGRYEEALECHRRAIEVDGSHAPSLFHAARLCDQRGMDETARQYYERIGPAQSTSYVHACLNLALIYEDEGEYDRAADCCRRVLDVDPVNVRARMFLSDIDASSDMYYSPEETKQSERMEAVLRVPVSDFELSVRSRNCLAKMNIVTLGDLVKKTESEMLAYKNFGETSLREIKEMLSSRGLRLGMMREDAATRAAMERKRHGANQEVMEKSIADLELSVRSRKAMERLNIRSLGDLLERSEAELASVKNFGRISLNEIKKRLHEMGLSLRESR